MSWNDPEEKDYPILVEGIPGFSPAFTEQQVKMQLTGLQKGAWRDPRAQHLVA